MRAAVSVVLLLSLAACKPVEAPRTTAIVGAVLIDGGGGPPLSDSLVLISGGRITAAGRRTEISIPPDANVIDGGGHYLVPALVDVSVKGAALAHVSTLAEARSAVSAEASAFVGIMRDADVDPALASQLRDLKVVVAPALSAQADPSGVARRNTLRLFAAGVPIAVAGNGDPQREIEALAAAGIPPLDVIVAATSQGAGALGQAADRGRLEPGKRADLLVLTANPGEDVRNLRKVERKMEAGEWK